MKTVAFLFPGQGSQMVGMGRAFYDQYPLAREVFQEGDDLLGMHLSKALFEGPEELLKQTLYSQPGIYVTSIAILRVLQNQFPQLTPVVCAGHSLGEYTALTAGGWLSFNQTLELVHFRSEAMSADCAKNPGAMAAILGMDLTVLTQVVKEVGTGLWIANINCPGQIVISGTVAAIQQGIELAKAKGAKRAILLPVQGAFHSGLMKESEKDVSLRLDHTSFASKGIPILSNSIAKISKTAEEIKENLKKQITSSVLWSQSIEQLTDISLFLEIGPGKVLAGLNKKIGVLGSTVSVGDPSDLELVSQAM